MFQSTHPRGVRRLAHGGDGRAHAGRFNPRTRVGCDSISALSGRVDSLVSIHAPAWGATRLSSTSLTTSSRFNPRTRVGCDVDGQSLSSSGARFQSTHPRGVRHSRRPGYAGRGAVSIHAPAWGATPRRVLEAVVGVVSIHAPAWGATRRPGRQGPGSRFQSTHPRGVRLGARMGLSPRIKVSIHAPAWGATRQGIGNAQGVREFQSTHPRGVRLFPCFIQ